MTTAAVVLLFGSLLLFVGLSDCLSVVRPIYGSRFASHKRMTDGNPCPEAEKPFPCKSTPTCIPMGYLCDDNQDCEDGYDEDPEVCTAAHRPPVEDILHFLESEKSWIMDEIFAGRDIAKVAHGLAVSPTVEDFKKRLGMTSPEVANLKTAVDAVKNSQEDELIGLGMPPSAWNEVSFIFSKLIKSGFTA